MDKSSIFSPNNLAGVETLNSKVETIKNKVSNTINSGKRNLVDHLKYSRQAEQLLTNESTQLLIEAIRGIEREEVDLDLHNSIHSLRFSIAGGLYKEDYSIFEETLANLQHALEWSGRAKIIKENVPKEYLDSKEFKELLHEFILETVHFTRTEYEDGIKLLTGAAIKGNTPDDFWCMLYGGEEFFEELFIADVVGDNFDKVVVHAQELLNYCSDLNVDAKCIQLLTFITLAGGKCKRNTKTEYYTNKDTLALVPLYAITGIDGMCQAGITAEKLYNYYKAITNQVR